MARCPNCDRETVRTTDWACQWCGHPLLTGHYKKIKKTFRELKEERESQQFSEEVSPEPPSKASPAPVVKPKPAPAAARAPEPVRKAEPEPPPEPPVIQRPATNIEAAAQATPSEPAPPPPTAAQPQVAAEKMIEPAPASQPQLMAETRIEPILATLPQPAPEVKPQPASPALEITVADLLSAYETEGPDANARFAGKVLKVTGAIDKINVKTALDVYQITLNNPGRSLLLQGVRCVFDRKYAGELNRLAPGQTVTVQGKYDGSIIDISLRDCFLVTT